MLVDLLLRGEVLRGRPGQGRLGSLGGRDFPQRILEPPDQPLQGEFVLRVLERALDPGPESPHVRVTLPASRVLPLLGELPQYLPQIRGGMVRGLTQVIEVY